MRQRALVLNLDDTLYPERRFALSGYAAVAEHLHVMTGIPASDTFRSLAGSLRRGRRGVAFQDLCRIFALDPALIPALIGIYRCHVPRLRLPEVSLAMLVTARTTWRVGILTNGPPGVQARKTAALRLHSLVDVVVLAEEHGAGFGKPDPAVFEVVLDRLGVRAEAAVFAGDDPVRDMSGARRVGMRTILVRANKPARRGTQPEAVGDADAVVKCVTEIPAMAETLLAMGGAYVH